MSTAIESGLDARVMGDDGVPGEPAIIFAGLIDVLQIYGPRKKVTPCPQRHEPILLWRP